MRTVWIYVDTNQEVGDRDHLKVFASLDIADEWSKGNDLARCIGWNAGTDCGW